MFGTFFKGVRYLFRGILFVSDVSRKMDDGDLAPGNCFNGNEVVDLFLVPLALGADLN